MTVSVVTPPEPLVSLDVAKQHLRVDTSDQDALITAYVAAASAIVDGPEGWLGRAVGVQTLQYSGRFPCASDEAIRLPCPIVSEVVSIDYDDEDGNEQSFDPASWRLTSRGWVELVDGETWPTTRAGCDAVRIEYDAGHADIPAAITAAVLLLVGDLYTNRETVTLGQASAIPMSPTVDRLLSPYRFMTA